MNIQLLQDKYPTARFVTYNIDDLNNRVDVYNLFVLLNLKTSANVDDILIKPVETPKIAQDTLYMYNRDICNMIEQYKSINVTIDINSKLFDNV